MKKRKPIYHVTNIKPINLCGETLFYQVSSDGKYEIPFAIEPTSGEHDYNKCDTCQKTIEKLTIELKLDFTGFNGKRAFPNCCDHHSNLTKLKEFDINSFSEIPEMVASKIVYTNQHITNHLQSQDSFKEISDYIEYTWESFGSMPNGFGPPVYLHVYYENLKNTINGLKLAKKEKGKLLKFIDELRSPPKRSNFDFQRLLETYEKWLELFPFDITFFKDLKDHYKSQLPIFIGPPDNNKYSGSSKFKMHTEGSLVEVLIKITKSLLDRVNVSELRKQGLITDIGATQIEFIDSELKTKTKQITNKFSKGELKYVNTVKKWLKVHKEYFEEIVPLITKKSEMPVQYTIKKDTPFRYLTITVTDQNEIENLQNYINKFPSAKKVNINQAASSNKKHLTVQIVDTYSKDEAEKEIEIAINSYFERGKLDPIFPDLDTNKISDKGFSNIIEKINHFGWNLEKSDKLKPKFDEEGYRDYFLPYLNGISTSLSATGETFNKKGKTDILIQSTNGKVVFVAECKLWKGEEKLIEAVDQLLTRYVNWRDEKVAIIVFNKDMKNFTDLLAKAKEKLKSHKNFKKYISDRNESSFTFQFSHPDDPNKIIDLELIIFNCYTS